MGTVLACVDGSLYSDSVADHAAWAAARMTRTVELLQVLGRRDAAGERPSRLVIEGQRELAEELASVEAARFRLLQQQARLTLEAARTRIEAMGVPEVAATLRTGDLLDEIATREGDACLLVIGKRGEAADFARLHLGSNLERIVRASRRPVLIAARAFRPVRRILIAFDGRASAMKAVDEVSRSPLFTGLSCDLLMVGREAEETRRMLASAAGQLRAGGLCVSERIEQGAPDAVIPAAVERDGVDMLVMGAYGHSRLRTLVIGSTTSETIRAARVPIMVYR